MDLAGCRGDARLRSANAERAAAVGGRRHCRVGRRVLRRHDDYRRAIKQRGAEVDAAEKFAVVDRAEQVAGIGNHQRHVLAGEFRAPECDVITSGGAARLSDRRHRDPARKLGVDLVLDAVRPRRRGVAGDISGDLARPGRGRDGQCEGAVVGVLDRNPLGLVDRGQLGPVWLELRNRSTWRKQDPVDATLRAIALDDAVDRNALGRQLAVQAAASPLGCDVGIQWTDAGRPVFE